MRLHKDQRGFNLINLIVSAALVAVIVTGVKIYSHYKARAATEKLVLERAAAIKARFESQVKFDAGWQHTINSAENANMACLRNHETCYDRGGSFVLRDVQNRLVYNAIPAMSGLTLEGLNCSSFNDAGNESCPFRLDLRWKPLCEGTCIDPAQVKITGKLIFRGGTSGDLGNVTIPEMEFSYTRTTLPGIPRTCYDHLLAGKNTDGILLVQPDPSANSFPVFCDQTRDGGGWALVMEADQTNYDRIVEVETLPRGSTGRLPKAKIAAYLNASSFLSQNNIRMELPGVDGGLVLGASTNGAVDADAYTAPMPPGDCRSVPEKPNLATHVPSPNFTFGFTGSGVAEYSEQTEAKSGFFGFRVCFGKDFLGQNCGTACERQWTGSLLRQRGLIWVR